MTDCNLVFNLPRDKNPTFFNLHYYLQAYGWQFVSSTQKTKINENTFDFDPQLAQTLEFKHHLARLIEHSYPKIMPQTYCINDDNWQNVLQALYYHPITTQWILKPALMNNGQYIKIFNSISALADHYRCANRLGGEHVVQHYLAPDLLRDNRKYSIRNFIVLTNYAGAFHYHEGYFNVALTPYSHDLSDLQAHLTNEHLKENQANTLQIPGSQFAFYEDIKREIKRISCQVIRALHQHFPDNTRTSIPQLALFGFDFMRDSNQKLWLLEANHGPCFPVDLNHPLQPYVYQPFWQQFIRCFLYPIATGQTNVTPSQSFQKL